MQLRDEFLGFVHEEMHASDAKVSNSVGLLGLTCSSLIDGDPDANTVCYSLFSITDEMYLRCSFLRFVLLERNFWKQLRTVRLFIGGSASALLIFLAACYDPDCSQKEKNIYTWLTLMVSLLIVGTSTLIVIWSHTEKINLPSASSRFIKTKII